MKLEIVPMEVLRWKSSRTWKPVRDGGLPDFQMGWYFRLLLEAADAEGYLPNDISQLWRLAGAKSQTDFDDKGGRAFVDRFFRRTDDSHRIYNPRLLEIINEQAVKSKAAARQRKRRDSHSSAQEVVRRVSFSLKDEKPEQTLLLNDGTEYEIFPGDVEEFVRLYPAVDVLQELRNMRGWLKSNPTRRKTRTGIARFVNNWLAKAQNTSRNGVASGKESSFGRALRELQD